MKKSGSTAGSPKPKPTRRALPPPATPEACRIVGIGASAGGMEALELFLQNVPPDSGLAYVIVQHLDPTHDCLLAELLQRHTPMPVVEISDRASIEANHVYVIPPNRDLSILHHVAHLLEPERTKGLKLPIDSFLRSLADDEGERAIGVILSGMGSDGTKGLQAIKSKGGATFVQSPESARFNSMPRSAINAGLIDDIAPPDQLPARLFSRLHHPVVPAPQAVPDTSLSTLDAGSFDKLILLLRTHTGQDFSLYKKSTLCRRIERRMALHQLEQLADYVRFLRENPAETDLLFRELLIGVTNFFRDPPLWLQLRNDILPQLLSTRPEGRTLRVWVPGCSSGEEAYSLAILFRETMDELHPNSRCPVQIFATDLDKSSIDKARSGLFSFSIVADVDEARLKRFFVREESGYRICKEIRELIIFAPHNVATDPPFTKLDLLSCRNLLIYLEPVLQRRVLSLFHYSLIPGGILVLGSSETAGQSSTRFTPLPGKLRLYSRHGAATRMESIDFGTATLQPQEALPLPVTMAKTIVPNLQSLTEALLLQRCAPPGVLATAEGDILYISGRTGRFLEPATGKANLNLFAMARQGLGGALNEAFAKALRKKSTVTLREVPVGSESGPLTLDLSVLPLTEPAALNGLMLVTFTELPRKPVTKATGKKSKAASGSDTARVSTLVRELQQARDELQAAREDMQSSQEELKSANEELQSTNEELQSTNEELTTSREEMQSVNEELQTVNQELQAKVDELSSTSDDMKNLLNSTDIATLFLDEKLCVRRFTTQTAGIIKLIPGDAGRPITDLVSDLDYPTLADDAREVLHSLSTLERRVSARDARAFTIRLKPYRTQDNRIDGVIITFLDVSKSTALENTLRETLTLLQSRFDAKSLEVDAAKCLEAVLRKGQAVLEERLSTQHE